MVAFGNERVTIPKIIYNCVQSVTNDIKIYKKTLG